MELLIDKLAVNSQCQARAEFSSDYADELKEFLEAGGQLPPVVAFRDSRGTVWLADGFHRTEAHKRARRKTILADVRRGEVRDAVLFAAGANKQHGLHRTHRDKRKAVSLLLTDREWSAWKNRRIADHCGVSEGLVRTMRDELEELLRQKSAAQNNGHARVAYDTHPPEDEQVRVMEELSTRQKKQIPYREMDGEELEEEVREENSRHRWTWLEEGRGFLHAAAERYTYLSDTHGDVLEAVRVALAREKAATKKHPA